MNTDVPGPICTDAGVTTKQRSRVGTTTAKRTH